MNKEKKTILYKIIVVLLSVTSTVLSVLAIILLNKSNIVINESINNVVEVKSIVNGGEAFGSGTIIGSDGLIITNAHIVVYKDGETISECSEVYARLPSEEEYFKCELIDYDYSMDLAKVKANINSKGFKLKRINHKNAEEVFTISNSMNYGVSYSKGIISRAEVIIEYHDKKNEFIQVDCNASSGSSGGALINKKGRLIGIIAFRSKDANNNINYGYLFCIPIKVVIEYVN